MELLTQLSMHLQLFLSKGKNNFRLINFTTLKLYSIV